MIHWDKGFGKLALNVELAPLDDAIMFALLKYSTLKKGSLDYGCASLILGNTNPQTEVLHFSQNV